MQNTDNLETKARKALTWSKIAPRIEILVQAYDSEVSGVQKLGSVSMSTVHKRRNRHPIVWVIAVALTVSAVLPHHSTEAFDTHVLSEDCIIIGNIRYQFMGANWTTALRQLARSAISEWNPFLDHEGNPLADIRQGTNANTITIRRVAAPGGNPNSNGRAFCAENRIDINDSLDGNQLQDVVAHEMGHILGLRHTGSGDSPDGRTPIMSTCATATERSMSRDDAAGLVWRRDRASAYRSYHANSGFERGTAEWQFSGSHSKLIRTNTAHRGARSLGWKPITDSAYVQGTAVVTGHANRIKARASYRLTSGGNPTGAVLTEVRVGTRAYGRLTNAPNNCRSSATRWRIGRDMNAPTDATPPFQLLVVWGTRPTSSWVGMETESYPHGANTNEGIRPRIRIRSTIRVDGQRREIGIDNARILPG